MAEGIATGNAWAISSGNAGAFHTTFKADIAALDELDWPAIRATQWSGMQHQKSAEFLVANFFPWKAIHEIGCENQAIADTVRELIANIAHQPSVTVKKSWYY